MLNEDNNDRVELKVLGVTSNTMQSGIYAIILAQVDGPYRIPIVTGLSEAQAISIKMENFSSPRPLLPDLFCSFAHGFGIEIKEVVIYGYQDGIFSAEIHFADSQKELVMDCRTSDAIAIALYCQAPIYTTKDILQTVGTIFDENPDRQQQEEVPAKSEQDEIEQINKRLAKAIEEENYEEAARLKEQLKNLEK